MKKVFALLLSVAMVICMMPSMAFASGETVTFDPASLDLAVGSDGSEASGELKATVLPDSTELSTVTFESSDDETVTVDKAADQTKAEAGEVLLTVTAKKAGSATITAKVGGTDAGTCAVTVKTKEATPEGVEFTATGADKGTLSKVTTAMEYSIDGGKTWETIADNTVAIESGVTVENGIKVHTKASDTNKADSDPLNITVTKAKAPAADAVTGTACTAETDDDGKLTGVTNKMEYQKDGTSDWTEGTGSDITVDKGTYYIRVKATGTVLASDNLTVTIAAHDEKALGGFVSITGDAKFDAELTADISKVTNLTDGQASYQWKRVDENGDETNIGTDSNKYTIVKEDIGKTITVTVTSKDAKETGEVASAPTAKVEKADGPKAPKKLVGVAPTTEDGKGKITGTTTDMEYSTDKAFTTPEGTECGADETELDAGKTYYVRMKATDTQKAGEAATVEVKGFVAATGITLDKTTITSFTVGETQKITATVKPDDCTQTVTWTSGTEATATVDKNGVVTAVAAGTTIITATVGDQSATCEVTVTAAEAGTYLVKYDANGGTGTMDAKNLKGEYVVLDCAFTAPVGNRFAHWAVDAADGEAKAPGDKITLESAITFYAVWEEIPQHNVTVTDGTATVDDEEVTKAAEGATVTITADAAPSGQVFDKWEIVSGTITLANASSATTTFTMLTEDVSVKATYKAAGGGGGYIPPVTDPLPSAKNEATNAVQNYVKPADYEDAEAAEIKAIMDKAAADIKNAKTAEEVKAIEAAAKAEIDKLETAEEKAVIRTVKATKFKATSKRTTLNGKKAIKITWTVPEGMEFDGFEIFRSTKQYSGFGKKPFFTTTKQQYTNNKDLKTGKTYYYKVRAYKYVNDEKVYTEYSFKAIRTMK